MSPLVAFSCVLCVAAALAQAQDGGADDLASEIHAGVSARTIAECLGRGVNLGNMLESPRERSWGVSFKPWMHDAVRELGFDSVRIPIRWSDYAAHDPPYAIDDDWFARVEGVIDGFVDRGVFVIINTHHYEALYADPAAHGDRLVAIWRQVAERYAARPRSVVFELLNEPHAELTPDRWNDLLPRVLAAVRETNPDRAVIVGSGEYNSIAALDELQLPMDQNLIVTVHYYEPFRFTHQGASWVDLPTDEWVGTSWDGTAEELREIEADFDTAATWAREHGVPLHLGEFGAYSRADMLSRARWTRAVRNAAEKRGIPWHYWELASSFGIVDAATRKPRRPLVEALLDE